MLSHAIHGRRPAYEFMLHGYRSTDTGMPDVLSRLPFHEGCISETADPEGFLGMCRFTGYDASGHLSEETR